MSRQTARISDMTRILYFQKKSNPAAKEGNGADRFKIRSDRQGRGNSVEILVKHAGHIQRLGNIEVDDLLAL